MINNYINTILRCVFLFVSNLVVYGQLSTNHWISPIHSRDASQVEDHYVYLSTPIAIPFEVQITDGSGVALPGSPVIISKGNPVTFLVGDEQPSKMFVELADLNSVQTDKGLLLNADDPFYVSFRVRSRNQAGYLTSKGVLGNGQRFRLGSFPQENDGGSRNFYASVMAVEDNTIVTFSEYNTNVEFISNSGTIESDNLTVNLNAGETYTVSGYTNVEANLDGFIGALVTATKPITVNTGNALGSNGPERGQDFGIDQIVPETIVGQEYISVEGGGNSDLERLIIVATKDNTEIFINGSPVSTTTINAGDYYEVGNSFYQGTIHRNMYVFASEPVYVYQSLSGGFGRTTSGMNFLPPLNCLLLTEVDLIADIERIGSTDYFGDVIAITRKGADLFVNESPVLQVPQAVLGTSDWQTYRISGLSGNVKVSSTGPLSVGLFGFDGRAAGFGGYYSGFGYEGQNAEVSICEDAGLVDILKEIPGNPLSGGVWTPRFNSNTNEFDPNLDRPGIYNYSLVNDCGNIDINVTIGIVPSIRVGVLSPLVLCDDDSKDGREEFDLTDSRIEALDGQSESDVAVSFFRERIDAEMDNNQLGLFYENTNPTEKLYIRVSSKLNPSCFKIGELDITVNTSIANAGPDVEISCLDETLTLNGGASSGLGIFTYLWTTTNGNIISGATTANPIVNKPGIYELTITSEFLGKECTDTDMLTVIDNFTLPIANMPNVTDIVVCDNDNDGSATNGVVEFDLSLNDAAIIGSQDASVLELNYFATRSDAEQNQNALPNNYKNITNPETIFARLTSTNQFCFDIVEFQLKVTPIPKANNSRLVQCDLDQTNSIDGITSFNLNESYNDITGGTPDMNLFFYKDMTDLINDIPLNPVGYRNTIPFSEVIQVKTLNTEACFSTAQLELVVNSTTTSLQVKDNQYTCDKNPKDAIIDAEFDLDAIKLDLYRGILEVAFYTSIIDASLEQNEISGTNYASKGEVVYARIENSGQCQGIEQFELKVNEVLQIDLQEEYTLCENKTLELSANPLADEYEWVKIEESGNRVSLSTAVDIGIQEAGNYSLIQKNVALGGQMCTNECFFEVKIREKAKIESIKKIELTQNNSVSVNISGNGDYEFALQELLEGTTLKGDPVYQDSNFFDRLQPGVYQVSVRNKQSSGCGVTVQLIYILGLPNFFTPNGDGVNDFWKLKGNSSSFNGVEIFIYNRFGKLIKQIDPLGKGWDGTYNGKSLPADEYWYTINLKGKGAFTGHFTLKR